jgi:hypothetical protein
VKPRKPTQTPSRTDLTKEAIGSARYVGSPEHKARRWWGGLPMAYIASDGYASRPGRQHTTVCPLVTESEREMATKWVQEALLKRQFRYFEGCGDFPKKIWYRDDQGTVWIGFCVNGVLGEYKGWPSSDDERVDVFG